MEFAAQRTAHGVEAVGIDAPTAVGDAAAVGLLALAFPNHDEIAGGVHGDAGIALVARGGGVDQGVGRERRVVGVEEPHVNVARCRRSSP